MNFLHIYQNINKKLGSRRRKKNESLTSIFKIHFHLSRTRFSPWIIVLPPDHNFICLPHIGIFSEISISILKQPLKML